MRPSTLTSRRALGVALGVTGAAVALSQYRSLQLPVRASSAKPPSSSPCNTALQQPASASGQVPPAGTMSSTGAAAQAGTAAAPGPLRTPLAAVNLRDIGEVDPGRLRKGVLFRCSQIYTPEVLRELKIKTVVDLRGRADRGKRGGSKGGGSSSSSKTAKPVGPPPLLPPDQVDALHASAGEVQAGSTPNTPGGQQQQQQQQPAGPSEGREESPGMDLTVTRLRRGGSSASAQAGASSSSASTASSEEDEGDGGNNNNGGGEGRRRAGHEEMVAALGEEADWQQPETENFNVIPGRQFGYAMLRMPPRIWRAAFGNLFTGKDPRRPFVDAFADEQLLGFTKYYKIILEHSKSNIAAVMRVFARPGNLPSLVHCAHGKDRTGVVIMLLLLLCDVPHEAIVADYVQSEIELRRYRESLGLPDPSGATGAIIPLNDVIIASTAETLRALLAYLDNTYISVEQYLASCGLAPQEVQAIRTNLLRPEAVLTAAATSGTTAGSSSSSSSKLMAGADVAPLAGPAGPGAQA